MVNYLEIDKTLVPYRFETQLRGATYTFEVFYNAEFDYFTIDLYKGDELIVAGEKVIYGKPLFSTFLHLNIPRNFILPYDLAENETRVTYDNLGETVFLYIIEGEVNE